MIEGLYIHVPFCDGKCHYCAFYSVPYSRERGAAWLSALKREAEAARGEFGPFAFSTIFMGGGTPTILPLDQLEELLALEGHALSWPGKRRTRQSASLQNGGVYFFRPGFLTGFALALTLAFLIAGLG